MSKSIIIKIGKNLSREEIKEKVAPFFIKEVSEDEYLLSFNSKWIWFFFEDEDESEYCIQFSSDFDQPERIHFLNELNSLVDYLVIDSDL